MNDENIKEESRYSSDVGCSNNSLLDNELTEMETGPEHDVTVKAEPAENAHSSEESGCSGKYVNCGYDGSVKSDDESCNEKQDADDERPTSQLSHPKEVVDLERQDPSNQQRSSGDESEYDEDEILPVNLVMVKCEPVDSETLTDEATGNTGQDGKCDTPANSRMTLRTGGALQSYLENRAIIHRRQKLHQCYLCRNTYRQKTSLNFHLMSHTGEKPHQCNTCQKTFTQKTHLSRHIMLVHTREKLHQCNICHKSFGYKQVMKRHMLIHTGERPHKCDICENTFTDKSTLKNHILIHTGEKPHECPMCQKTFAQRAHLKNHVLIHTRERPYVCSVCQKTFARKSYLNNHMLTH